MNIAVIFAGGAGKIMNTLAKPKQFLEMRGKLVLIYTRQHFQEHKDIDKIVLVCIESWIDYARKLAKIQWYACWNMIYEMWKKI